MYKFSIAGHTMGTPEYSITEALELFKSIGLDGAEIIIQDGYRCGIPSDCSQEELQNIKNCSDTLGIRIIALTPYFSYFNSLDNEKRNSDIAGIRKAIKYAKFLHAKYIRLYGGNFGMTETDPDNLKYKKLVEALKELGDDAYEADVILVVENHFNTMAVSAKQSKKLIDDVNKSSVRILYDQANLTFTLNEDYIDAINIQMDKVAYVHVKDLAFKEGSRVFKSDCVSHPRESDRNVISKIVGEGELNWPEILQMMKDKGYNGWLSLEYERRWHPNDLPDAAIGMKKSADYLRKCFIDLK